MISQRRKESSVASKGRQLHQAGKTTISTITHNKPEKPSNAPDVTGTINQDELHLNSSTHIYSSSSSSTIGSISHFEMKMKRLKKKTSRTHTTRRQINTSSQNNNKEKIMTHKQMSKLAFGDTDMYSTIPSNNTTTDKHAEQATWSREYSYHQSPTHLKNSPESACNEENISHQTHLTRHKTDRIQRSDHEIRDKHKPDFTDKCHTNIMNEKASNKLKNLSSKNFVGSGKYSIGSITKDHPITKLKISGINKAQFDQKKKGSYPAAKSLNTNNTERRVSKSSNAGPHDNNNIAAHNPYNVSPGPAMYSVPSFLGRGVPHKPSAGAAIILGRHATVDEQSNSPGPCYSPVPLNIYKKKQPQYSISTKNTSKHETLTPGPGAYSPTNSYKRNNLKGISFGQRHSIFRKTLYTNDDLL